MERGEDCDDDSDNDSDDANDDDDVQVREEHEKLQEITDKLKSENLELCQDARAAKTYRDELDVLRERAEKVISIQHFSLQIYLQLFST